MKIRGSFIILLVASVVLFLKLLVSYTVYGSNDINRWIYYGVKLHEVGTFKIYSLVELYNHPPLMSWVLKFVELIAVKSGWGFPYVFRLLPIFADYASAFVILGLLTKYKVKNKILISIICCINPINFLISGFHGNVDTVFIFFVLLAIYFAENENIIVSGLTYGLSICVKIAPLILAPIFIFYIKGKRKKVIFILSSLAVFLIVFLPYLINDYRSMIRNIFLYKGDQGVWGIWHILCLLSNNTHLVIKNSAQVLYRFYDAYNGAIFFITILILPLLLMRNKKLNLAEGTFFTFCLFLVIAPGFGVQYLSWLSFFSVMVLPALGTIYLVAGGFFLYGVYRYWRISQLPYYPDSYFGRGFNANLDIILWALIVIMLIKFVLKKSANEKMSEN